jgi:hypothetical protein
MKLGFKKKNPPSSFWWEIDLNPKSEYPKVRITLEKRIVFYERL